MRRYISLLAFPLILSTSACESTGPRYRNVQVYRDGLAAVQHANGRWGYINEQQNWVIAPKYEDAMPFQNGKAAVRQGGKWGFINRRGEWQ